MLLKTKVKVGNITNLSDARYCSGMGVDFLGFPFRPDHFDSDVKAFREISGWVSGPDMVLEWPESEIHPSFLTLVTDSNDALLQIGVSALENFQDLKSRLIVKVRPESWSISAATLKKYASGIQYLLLVSDEDTVPDYELIREIGKQFPLLLGSGVSEKNIDELLTLPIQGIALQGSPEERPGTKEYGLAAVLEKLETW